MNQYFGTPGEIDRRTFLGSLATTGVTAVAGCGDSKGSDPNTSTGVSANNRDSIERQRLHSEIEKLDSIFRRLSEVPVVDEGEFVFDVKQFEEEFDRDPLMEEVEETLSRMDSIASAEIPESKARELESIAKTAGLLVQQRVIIHQVIAAGLTCEKRFYEMDIERAIEAITNARQFLMDLDSIGERIDESIGERSNITSLVDGYDPMWIMRTQNVLVEITLWTNPAYEGIHRVMEGMGHFVEGNSALEEELYEDAELAYRDSSSHFEKAKQAFRSSHNQGSKLPYMAPFVEDLRCILPAYISSSERLSEAMRRFQAGEQARGMEVAKEGIKSADRIAPRCF